MIITMSVLNILLVPLFTPTPIESIMYIMLPGIIPANALGGTINAVATFTIFNNISKHIRIKDYDTK